jgi:hypothetical protein
MRIENDRGFGKTRVEWAVESETDETATALNAAIHEAIESVAVGDSEVNDT